MGAHGSARGENSGAFRAACRRSYRGRDGEHRGWCRGRGSGEPGGGDRPRAAAGGERPGVGRGRTGLPQASAIYDLGRYGYTEQEYFVEGTATSTDIVPTDYVLPDSGPTVSPGTKARYKTRMVVIRPPRERFNGWAMVEWANVTFQQDVMFAASELHAYLMREGYAMVFVSAQKQGVDGAPTSMRSWDPVRYGSLVHPGDAYSFDIFSQALAAVRTRSRLQIDPMGGLPVDRVIADGSSQSCGRLKAYINGVAEAASLADGYLPLICGAGVLGGKQVVVPDTAPPTMWVNSELEGQFLPGPDSMRFRIWEVAGSSHIGNYPTTQAAATMARDDASVGGSPTPGIGWDPEAERQYGERASQPCLNFFPLHYSMIAGAEALRSWIVTGRAPQSARYQRDESAMVSDGDGNARGGVRLPPIDVPVATYAGNDCRPTIMGSTHKFEPAKLASRYPTHDDYVEKMAAATGNALARGWMLQPEAIEMMSLAKAAPIPS